MRETVWRINRNKPATGPYLGSMESLQTAGIIDCGDVSVRRKILGNRAYFSSGLFFLFAMIERIV